MRHRQRAPRVEDLAERRGVRRDLDLGPVAGAEQVAGVDLGDLDDLLAAGDAEVHGLRGVLADPLHRRAGQPDQLLPRVVAGGVQPEERSRRRTTRTASRSTRPVRSSAVSIREVVDFARPLDSWRSAKVSGSSACTTVDTSWAARSTACVPVLVSAMLPLCASVGFHDVELWSHIMRLGWRTDVPQQDAALRDPVRGGDGHSRQGLAPADDRDRRRVHGRPGARPVPPGRPARGGQDGVPRPRLGARAGGQGAARVRPPGPQPGATRSTSAATRWCSAGSTDRRSSATARCAATGRWTTSGTSPVWPRASRCSTRPVA